MAEEFDTPPHSPERNAEPSPSGPAEMPDSRELIRGVSRQLLPDTTASARLERRRQLRGDAMALDMQRRADEERADAPESPYDEQDAGAAGGEEGGEVGSHSTTSMSSSDDEAIAFIGGQDCPEEFMQQVRLATANKKGMDTEKMLGEIVKRMKDREEAELVLRWKELQFAGEPGAPLRGPVTAEEAARTGENRINLTQLQGIFTHQFPLVGKEDRAESELDAYRQKGPIKQHNAAYNKLLQRATRLGAVVNKAALEAIVDRNELTKYMNSLCATLPKDMLEEHDCTPMRSQMLKRRRGMVNLYLLQQGAQAHEEDELIPCALDCEIKHAAYWKTPKAKPKAKKAKKSSSKASNKTAAAAKKRKGKQAVSSDSTSSESEVEVNYAGEADMQLSTLNKRLDELEKAVTLAQQVEQRLLAKMEAGFKEQRKEIEEDLVNPVRLRLDKFETLLTDMHAMLKTSTQPMAQQSLGAPDRRQMPMRSPGGYGQRQLSLTAGRPPRHDFRGPAQSSFRSKAPLICWNCKKEGHPFRLCPDLEITACVECLRAVDAYDQGGTEVCTIESIRDSFDPSGDIQDDDIICHICVDWAHEKLASLYSKPLRHELQTNGDSQMGQQRVRLRTSRAQEREQQRQPEVTSTKESLSDMTTGAAVTCTVNKLPDGGNQLESRRGKDAVNAARNQRKHQEKQDTEKKQKQQKMRKQKRVLSGGSDSDSETSEEEEDRGMGTAQRVAEAARRTEEDEASSGDGMRSETAVEGGAAGGARDGSKGEGSAARTNELELEAKQGARKQATVQEPSTSGVHEATQEPSTSGVQEAGVHESTESTPRGLGVIGGCTLSDAEPLRIFSEGEEEAQEPSTSGVHEATQEPSASGVHEAGVHESTESTPRGLGVVGGCTPSDAEPLRIFQRVGKQQRAQQLTTWKWPKGRHLRMHRSLRMKGRG
jgi:hypothetical protein